MNSVEVLVLFSVAAVLAAISVSIFLGQTRMIASKGTSASHQVANSPEFCILSVSSGQSDSNVFVRGVYGSIRVNPKVYVDGIEKNLVSTAFVDDRDGDGILDVGDVLRITVSGPVFDGNLHRIRVLLGTVSSELTALRNGDPGNC